MLSWKYPETCLLDDSRSCQADNHYELPHLDCLLETARLELCSFWLFSLLLLPFGIHKWNTPFFCEFLISSSLSLCHVRRVCSRCWVCKCRGRILLEGASALISLFIHSYHIISYHIIHHDERIIHTQQRTWYLKRCPLFTCQLRPEQRTHY